MKDCFYKIFTCTSSSDIEKSKWFEKKYEEGWELVCPDMISVSSGYTYNSRKYIFRKKISYTTETKEETI